MAAMDKRTESVTKTSRLLVVFTCFSTARRCPFRKAPICSPSVGRPPVGTFKR